MGFNKAFIKVDGQTIIERCVAVLCSVFEEVNIIADNTRLYDGLGLAVLADEIKGAGSLGGVYTALIHSPAERVFVAACDMPYLDAASVKATVELSEGCTAAVPFINGRFHPMHSVYSKGCVKAMEEMIEAGDLRINDLLTRIETKRLTEKLYAGAPIARSVVNVNTREDLERVETRP